MTMPRDVIATGQAPRAIGPYSQAIRANGFVFVSGQGGVDPATQEIVAGGVREQTERVLRNIDAILRASGSGLDKVVRCGVFLKDMNDFAAMNEVYARFFPGTPPARTTIEAARLPKDLLVEIDAVALA
jgi:2-iminobutanoate/2-iminopropanoate deaminase